MGLDQEVGKGLMTELLKIEDFMLLTTYTVSVQAVWKRQY